MRHCYCMLAAHRALRRSRQTHAFTASPGPALQVHIARPGRRAPLGACSAQAYNQHAQPVPPLTAAAHSTSTRTHTVTRVNTLTLRP